MGRVTESVRRALADLGPDATVRSVIAYILEKDPTVPKGYALLAMRNLKTGNFSVVGKRPQHKQTYANSSQGTFEFLKEK